EVRHADSPAAEKLIKEHRIELRQNGNDVSIIAHTPPSLNGFNSFFGAFNRPNLDVHYEIDVPQKYFVDSQTAGGDMTVAHLQGDAKVVTMGGRVELADIDGAANAKTMGGDVAVSKCTGDLRAHTSGGAITLKEFSGPCIHADTMG